MAKTYMTSQINNSATIAEVAGAAIADVRGKFVKYDNDGNVVLASTAGEVVLGVGIITNSENLAAGDNVDIQVKDIGLAKAGVAITKGAEITVDANGTAGIAAAGNFVIGVALQSAAVGEFFYFQVAKYIKVGSTMSSPNLEEEDGQL